MATSTLRIIHTNDFHGWIEDFGKIAAYVDAVRLDSEHVLWLDAGDICSGHPVVDTKQGAPIVALLNLMRLDVMAIGNHDFDYGPDSFAANQAASSFPWLAANVTATRGRIHQPEAFRMFDVGPLKVGVVAVTQAPPATRPSNVDGLQFEAPEEALRRHAYLRDEVDVLIALTHVGFSRDCELAAQVEGYDLILGGHSHTAVEREVVNGTTIVNTGAYAEYVGDVTVRYDHDKGRIEGIDTSLIPVKDLTTVNESVHAAVMMYFEEARDLLQQEIGVTTGLSLDTVREGDAPLGNFWTDALRHCTGADIGLMNVGGIRAPIPAGTMTLGHVLKMAPFHNELVLMEMTGQAISDVLRFSFSRSDRIDLQVSGVEYVVWTDETGTLVDLEVFRDGAPLDLAASWRVVTNEYLLTSSEPYPFRGQVMDGAAGEMSEALTQYAAHCMREKGVIDSPRQGRIVVKNVNSR